MRNCKICANEDCTWHGRRNRVSNDCLGFEPQTNADRIRAMTDAELTRFFAENCGCDDWCMHKRSGACASKSENACCLDVWYDWLKSPVEVDK